MSFEGFGGNDNNDNQNNSFENKREVYDLNGYGIELRNKNERIQLLEDRENEVDNIKSVLYTSEQYDHSQEFFIHNGNYYHENPLRVNPQNPSDIIYLQMISKNELQDRLNELEESLIENNIGDKLNQIDKLISENEDNPNLRAMLIETRIGLTGIDETSYLAKSDSLNSFLHLIEKSETEILSVTETIAVIGHGLNISRYYFPDLIGRGVNGVKDVTTSKLFKFGKENAPGEQKMEDLVLKYGIADSKDDLVVEISKIPPAVLAGCLDGALDFIQSNIDIVLVPDKILGGLVDLVPLISKNIGTLGENLVKGIENESDIAYIISYAVTVIFAIFKVNPGVGIFTIPSLIIKALNKFNLSPKVLAILETNLNGNIEKIGNAVRNTVNKVGKTGLHNTAKVLEKGRNITDSAKTGANRMQGTSDKIIKSREVLKKLNDTIILSDIFGKNMDKFVSKKENTDIALKVYEEDILKDNGMLLDNIEDMIKDSNGELQYNLLRIRERFDEMKNIFEKEVFPIKDKRDELKHNYDVIGLLKIDKFYNSKLGEMNKLTKLILSKYILDK